MIECCLQVASDLLSENISIGRVFAVLECIIFKLGDVETGFFVFDDFVVSEATRTTVRRLASFAFFIRPVFPVALRVCRVQLN